MNYFNPESLGSAKKEVEEIFQASDKLGLDIIRVVHKKSGAHVSGTGGFDVPRAVVGHNGLGATATLVRGIVYFYPDASRTKHGFVLDTDRNRRILANSLSGNIMTILNKKDKEMIIEVAKKLGKPTERVAYTPSYVPDSTLTKKTEKKLEEATSELSNVKADLEADRAEIMRLKHELDNAKASVNIKETTIENLEEDKEVVEERLEVSKANDVIDASITTLEDKQLNADGEVETVKTEVTKPVKRRVVKKRK